MAAREAWLPFFAPPVSLEGWSAVVVSGGQVLFLRSARHHMWGSIPSLSMGCLPEADGEEGSFLYC